MTRRTNKAWLPVNPPKHWLAAMAEATFISDRSDLEMHRRYNGLRNAIRADAAKRLKGRK